MIFEILWLFFIFELKSLLHLKVIAKNSIVVIMITGFGGFPMELQKFSASNLGSSSNLFKHRLHS